MVIDINFFSGTDHQFLITRLVHGAQWLVCGIELKLCVCVTGRSCEPACDQHLSQYWNKTKVVHVRGRLLPLPFPDTITPSDAAQIGPRSPLILDIRFCSSADYMKHVIVLVIDRSGSQPRHGSGFRLNPLHKVCCLLNAALQ